MEKHAFVYQSTTLFYYQSAGTPKLLLTSGFHGNEADVIPLLTNIIFAQKDRLPPFLFVPVACPSAVALGTRLNKNNADINRSYFLDSPEEEAQALMRLLSGFRFDIAYSFHEDPEERRFYLYDMGEGVDSQKIEELKKAIRVLGVDMFDGIDDLEDPSLGREIIDGYFLEKEEDAVKNGFFNGYLLSADIAYRHLNPEIPGSISKEKKSVVLQAIFDILILPS